jgi:hypothetical protein
MRSKITILLAGFFVTLFLAACGADYYDRVIRNNTTSTNVSYVYDGKDEILGPNGDFRTYSVTLAVHAPSAVVPDGDPRSVVMRSDGFDYIFEDAAIKLVVYNTLTETISISNEYIDADTTNTSYNETSVNVDANDNSLTSNANAVIYTANPVFTVTPASGNGSKARAEWEIKPDTANSNTMTCFVTIVAAD